MKQLDALSLPQLKQWRATQRARRQPPAVDEFRTECQRRRDYGLIQRHARKLARVNQNPASPNYYPHPWTLMAEHCTPGARKKPARGATESISARATGPTKVLSTPKTAAQEVAVPEAAVPEATVPEAAVPEATGPKAAVPKATAPEFTAPKATGPKATGPKAAVPKATGPKAAVPKATAPEFTAPKVTAPGRARPEVIAPVAARRVLLRSRQEGSPGAPMPPTGIAPHVAPHAAQLIGSNGAARSLRVIQRASGKSVSR